MKRGNTTFQKMSGVTLLEILLVLAISATFLISSIRYYESAVYSLQANNALEQAQSITAAIDNFIAGTSSYLAVSTSTLNSFMPPHSLTTPWGTEMIIDAAEMNSYTVTFPNTPAKICPLISSKLANNKHYQISSTCGDSATDFTYIYLANA